MNKGVGQSKVFAPNGTVASPETPFLVDLFERFNVAGIRYCVLGGSGQLPFNAGGGDVDILVSPDSIGRAEELASEAACAHGGRCISHYEVELRLFCFCGKDQEWWGVHVDLFPACAYRAVPFLDTEIVLHNAVASNRVKYAASEDAALYRCMKEVIFNGKPKKDYAEKAQGAYASKHHGIRAHLCKSLGEGLAELWCGALSGTKQPVEWSRLSKATRHVLVCRALRAHGPRLLLASKVINWSRRMRRMLRPPGAMIAVLGTDGSGKSTLLHAIVPVLRNALNHEPRYEHMRPNLFPSLAMLIGKSKPLDAGPHTHPHASSPSGFLGSSMRLAYYTIDYVAGYWFKVYPAMVKRSTVWLFDRYFYDYHIDPIRARICLPDSIIRLFSLLVPRPDLILCLGADPEVIHQRKPELPVEEVRRQVEELKTFCRTNPRAVWIDVGCSVEESVDHALDVLTSHMAARYDRSGKAR
jgi:thymidylate kinase